MTITTGFFLILIAFVLGYMFGEIGAYGKGYNDATNIYRTPLWTYKKKTTTRRKK